MAIVNRPHNLAGSCPADASLEDTRQAEMLLVGLSLDDTANRKKAEEMEKQSGKRRSLDDMRRLSEHIKAVPIYRGK